MTRAPEPPNNVKRRGRIHTIDGKFRYFTVMDEIVHEQVLVERGSRKLIYFQRIQFEDDGQIQYRFTYYMLGLRPGAKGRWVFGQYSLLIPIEDLNVILNKARELKWEGI